MRTYLKCLHGTWGIFTGRVARFGWNERCDMETVLLVRVTNSLGKIVTDHCWFNHSKQLRALDLYIGDTIEFMAFVGTYHRGYRGGFTPFVKRTQIDYRLHKMRYARKIDFNTEKTG